MVTYRNSKNKNSATGQQHFYRRKYAFCNILLHTVRSVDRFVCVYSLGLSRGPFPVLNDPSPRFYGKITKHASKRPTKKQGTHRVVVEQAPLGRRAVVHGECNRVPPDIGIDYPSLQHRRGRCQREHHRTQHGQLVVHEPRLVHVSGLCQWTTGVIQCA